MKKYSKKRLITGALCLIAGLIIFLYGALVVASSECTSCQNIAFFIVLISGLPILIGMVIVVKEFERYIYGPPHG